MIHPRVIAVKLLKIAGLNKIVARIYYKYFHGFNSAGGKALTNAVEKCFNKAVQFGTTEKGDYYEFGIFKGHTFAHACNYAKKINLLKMRFFGFDSFEGLPKIEGLDVTRDMPFYEGQYSAGKEQVSKDMSRAGVDWSKIQLIEGFFNDSLNDETRTKYNMKKINLALIDCDLHSSTVDVLNFIKDMLLNKTILMFDDWNTFDRDNSCGQRKAFRDFLDVNKHIVAEEYFSYGAWGKVFILNFN
ncbi:MAG: TylF/MycF/NovP-related O-methyltransferase [Melioribacteraceae bacterium]